MTSLKVRIDSTASTKGMDQDRIIPAMTEHVNHNPEHYLSSEEQIIRLQNLVAYLLEKNEQLRHIIVIQNERLPSMQRSSV